MSSTDDRIVKMQFDNTQFKQGAAETKQALADVNKAVDASGKSKGLMDLQSGMEKVSITASKMAVITTTALATITSKIVNSGLQLAKSLTFDPLKQGFSEYESLLTKQNVIQNATGKSASVVKGALNELNRYSDKTIYSFGNMTDAIQKFVNAGVPLKTSVTTIKGIANAAAFAGASSEEANRAMYAFSQSMSLGFVQLQDWNQIENANLGTIKFKESLLEAAVAAGTLTRKGKDYVTESGKTISATKGWRDGLQEQWATTEVLNKALGKYADTNTKLGRQAFKSAQEVRTFSAFMDTLKESIGSGWSQIFTTLIGGLDSSTKMWTNLSNSVSVVVQGFFKFTNATLKTFKQLGGMQKILLGFQNILAPFIAIFHAVGDAWRLAFPDKGPGSGEVLYRIASGFERITSPLQTVAAWIPKLVPSFVAFFHILGAGAKGVGELVGYLHDLADSLIGLVHIKAPSAGGFTNFFDSLIEKMSDLFAMGVDVAQKFMDGLIAGFRNGSFDTVANILGAGFLGAIFLFIRKIAKGGAFSGIFKGLTDSFSQLTGVLKSMQTEIQAKALMEIAIAMGVLTASMIALSFVDPKKLGKALTAISAGFIQLLVSMSLLSKIGGSAGFIKIPFIAAGMVLLAGSILVLTAAIALMSRLSWESIGKGLAGVSGALIVLSVGMKTMPKTLPITAAGLVLVGLALNEIATAMILFGTLSWSDIGKGMAVTAGGLVIIATAMKMMPKTLPLTAAGLVLVGVALNLIAPALKVMATMSWDDIGHGLATLGGSMAILALGLNLMKGTLRGSAAMVVAAAAIAILTPSLIVMSRLSWEQIAHGMVALAGGLAILAVALYAMSGSVAGAAALLIVSPALMALSTALVVLGQLSWEQIGAGLLALAGGLTVIGIAGALIGPVVPALLGLGAALLLLGAGLALAGAGIAAFAAGLTLLVGLGAGAISYMSKYIGAFIDTLPALGAGFGALIVELAKVITENTPVFVAVVVTWITQMLEAAGRLLPKLGTLVLQAIHEVIHVIRKAYPEILDAGISLILSLINGITKRIPDIANAATDLIIAFAQGIEDSLMRIVTAGINLIAEFLHELATVIRSGLGPIGAGLVDVLDAFFDLGKQMATAILNGLKSLGGDIKDGVLGIAGDAVHAGISFLSGGLIGRQAHKVITIFEDLGKFMGEGLSRGIQSTAASSIVAVASVLGGQIATANDYISQFIQKLDQQAIAARSKAEGLAAAAEKASKLAKKTKGKEDDKAANKIGQAANQADKAASEAEKKAEQAKRAQDRKEQFKNASLLEKAKMRSEDAQRELDSAKAHEGAAAKALAEADALEKQSRAAGVSPEERKKLQDEAKKLREQAAQDARAANKDLEQAKTAAASALDYQKKAGAEAAKAFQEAFDADAKKAADDAAFEKMSDEEKAAFRKKQAEELAKKAKEDLDKAKQLAFTDIDAANQLAQQAMNEADQARQYLTDAQNLSQNLTGTPSSNVVDLATSDAASAAMQDYSNQYNAAVASAAGDRHVEFNQYNQSPEALSPSEIYRQTNNLFTYAVDKLDEATAA